MLVLIQSPAMKFTTQPSENDPKRLESLESPEIRHAHEADETNAPAENRGESDRSPERRSQCVRIVLSWVVVAAIAALIFWMSAKDGVALDEHSGLISAVKAWLADLAQAIFGHPVDVSPIGHFTEYLAFGAALANALRWHLPLKRAALCAVVFASAYGVTDEIHQIFVPLRSCDPADWAVDTVAAAIGALVAFVFLRRKHKGRA